MLFMSCDGLFRDALVVYAVHLAKVFTGSNKEKFLCCSWFLLD